MGSLGFFLQELFLEKRFFNPVTDCKDFHELFYGYWDLLSSLMRTGRISSDAKLVIIDF